MCDRRSFGTRVNFGGMPVDCADPRVPGVPCRWLLGAMWAVAVSAGLLFGAAHARAQAAHEASPQKPPARFTLQADHVAALLRAAEREDADLWEPVRRVVMAKGLFGPDDLRAYEEHRLFVYALAVRGEETVDNLPSSAVTRARNLSCAWRRVVLMRPPEESVFLETEGHGSPGAAGVIKRVRLLRLVIEDGLSVSELGPRGISWSLSTAGAAQLDQWPAQLATPHGKLFWQTLVPELERPPAALAQTEERGLTVQLRREPVGGTARVIHAFWTVSARPSAQLPPASECTIRCTTDQTILAATLVGWTFRISWPDDPREPGRIGVHQPYEALLPERVLPAGILPHGVGGMRLMERWDAAYQRGNPGWDVGRPCSELRAAVEQGVLRPCRTVELGCGTGTNAIYLAQKGFDVTAIDVAPTALRLAEQKAEKAGVRVKWLLADVLRPPPLEPFDLVFDRGCYHGVRRHDAAGFVRALKQLTRPGALVLILAGNANEERHYGPPRVKEEELRADFSQDFEFVRLKETRFDTRQADKKGALAWSILLRRK